MRLGETLFCYIMLIISSFSFLRAQWLSGRVLDARPRGRGFEPHRRHYVVVLEQDTFILAYRQMAENGFVPPPPREFCRHIEL